MQKKYSYSNLYMRERLDKLTDTVEMEYGFETNKKTKPIIIGELVTIMREFPDIECDVETLKEMTTFVKKANGSQEAINGAHDDLVMALAIAHFISHKQTNKWQDIEYDGDEFLKNFHTDNNSGAFMNWEV